LAQIFLSHSQRDEGIKNLFLRAYPGTNVHLVLKEYETISPAGTPTNQISRNMANEIENDILMSAAVFVVLSETVQALPGTSHWIVYEAALAKAKQKPVWVFEPYDSHGRVNVEIPYFNHFVRLPMNEGGRRFVQQVIASYNDTPVLTTGGGALAGAAVGGWAGLLIGGILGYTLAKKVETPKGVSHTCDQCFVSYEVHVPGGKGEFRCPGCNKLWIIT
jgi:hypothetical protein